MKILPPVFVLVLLALIGAAHVLSPTHLPPVVRATGVPLALLGIGVAVAARRVFARRHANVYTFDTPTALVTDGVFARSRNPMYLGLALLLLGAALGSGSLLGLVVAATFVPVANRAYIAFEERKMRETFGAAYESYAARTPRWL